MANHLVVSDEYIVVPEIIKNRVYGLDHETRWKIVEIIMNYGKMQENEIINKMDTVSEGNDELSNHMKVLQETGVLDRFETFGNDNKVYYDIDLFSRKIINGFFSALDYSHKNSSPFTTYEYQPELGNWNQTDKTTNASELLQNRMIYASGTTPTEGPSNQNLPTFSQKVSQISMMKNDK